MSTYADCQCRDCFNIAVSADTDPTLCGPCEESGCIPTDGECMKEQWAEALEME